MPFSIVDLVAAIGFFVILPTIVVGGWLGSRFLKLKTAELELRRAELEVERTKVEYLAAESRREALERIEAKNDN